jgi:hypothetical protein
MLSVNLYGPVLAARAMYAYQYVKQIGLYEVFGWSRVSVCTQKLEGINADLRDVP